MLCKTSAVAAMHASWVDVAATKDRPEREGRSISLVVVAVAVAVATSGTSEEVPKSIWGSPGEEGSVLMTIEVG